MRIHRNWIVDFDAVWLTPIQHQTFGSITTTGIGSIPTTVVNTTNNEDFTLSPRITLGIQGDRWGVLVRYWQFQNGNIVTNVPVGQAIAGKITGNDFKAETLDLELARIIDGYDPDNMYRLSFGCRYAELGEDAQLASNTFAGLTNMGYVFGRSEFTGPGMTVGLQGLHRLNGSNFNLFFDSRVSYLYDTNASVAAIASKPNLDPAITISDAETSNANLFIGEIQLGGQWNLPLKCVPANAFVRVAFEYQYWKVTSSADAFSMVSSSRFTTKAEAHGNTSVDIVGFNIGTGLTW